MNDAMLAAIVGTYQAQDVRVSYEDMANPRRYGQVVEHRAGEFRVAWDDEGETWSDLRQIGWRREGDEHSASRRVDVLQREAPHLLAQPDEPRPSTLRIVVNMEADEPELLGTFQEHEDEGDQVWYTTSDGHYRRAPYDCVRIVTVTL